MPESQDPRPHVVMLAGNDVVTDTRIRKTALSLARLGLRVTVVAYASDGRRRTTQLGPVTIVRVPITWGVRDAVKDRRERRRTAPRLFGYGSRFEEREARVRAELGFQDGTLRGGLPGDLGKNYWRGRAVMVRARRRAQRDFTFGFRQAWRAYDKAISSLPVGTQWRRTVPQVHDFELAYRRVIDGLRPDVIHAHDVEMTAVAARAASRARRDEQRDVPWVYDAHEYVRGLSLYGGRTARVRAAWADLEDEFAPSAARIITVSPPIGVALQQHHHLAKPPAIVLNVPVFDAVHHGEQTRTVRDACGLGADVPLLVYSGGVTSARGVQTAVEALPSLTDVHLAVVAVPHIRTVAVERLHEVAVALGVADRVHLLDPVAPADVVPFLSGADVGLLPLLHYGSHEMALTNKLFEYLHAGLPVVVSDCAAQEAFVREHGTGEVHVAGDAVDLASAVRRLLADRDRYLARVRDPELLAAYTWEQQEQVLCDVYVELVGIGHLADPDTLPPFPVEGMVETAPAQRARDDGERVLVIGPANMAGQGWAWAKAVERELPGVRTEVLAVSKGGLDFDADVRVDPATFAKDTAWQVEALDHILDTATHVLLEAGRPLAGTVNGSNFLGDAQTLAAAGIDVGLVFHGSEIRDPRQHAARYPWSPFTDPREELTARLQRQLVELKPLVEAFDGPKFFSTPDLLDDVPDGTWLPVVVDTTIWVPGEPPLQRDVPVVVHAPSRRALKGTHHIEPVLQRLVAEGLIDYRRIEGVPPEQVPALFAEADIVLDHFGIGNYGVVTCQAMAMGRVSVSHIAERVRQRVPSPIPTIEATPDTLEAVLRDICADRDKARETAAHGPGFVAHFHDGRMSARALAPFLGIDVPTPSA